MPVPRRDCGDLSLNQNQPVGANPSGLSDSRAVGQVQVSSPNEQRFRRRGSRTGAGVDGGERPKERKKEMEKDPVFLPICLG